MIWTSISQCSLGGDDSTNSPQNTPSPTKSWKHAQNCFINTAKCGCSSWRAAPWWRRPSVAAAAPPPPLPPPARQRTFSSPPRASITVASLPPHPLRRVLTSSGRRRRRRRRHFGPAITATGTAPSHHITVPSAIRTPCFRVFWNYSALQVAWNRRRGAEETRVRGPRWRRRRHGDSPIQGGRPGAARDLAWQMQPPPRSRAQVRLVHAPRAVEAKLLDLGVLLAVHFATRAAWDQSAEHFDTRAACSRCAREQFAAGLWSLLRQVRAPIHHCLFGCVRLHCVWLLQLSVWMWDCIINYFVRLLELLV